MNPYIINRALSLSRGSPSNIIIPNERGNSIHPKNSNLFSPVGQYVSAADVPFSQRSLPPSSLDVKYDPNNSEDIRDHPYSYHMYTVKRRFAAIGGPIAPWFGQPGLGAQFFVGEGNKSRNINTLIADGYLERANISHIKAGPGNGNRCG